MDTRTIAIAAFVIAVLLVLVVFVLQQSTPRRSRGSLRPQAGEPISKPQMSLLVGRLRGRWRGAAR